MDLTKIRAPAGSLVVDGVLVASMLWYGGQLTERLEHISARVDSIEDYHTRVNGESRLYVLERRAVEMSEDRTELRAQLTRIEEKLDALQERVR